MSVKHKVFRGMSALVAGLMFGGVVFAATPSAVLRDNGLIEPVEIELPAEKPAPAGKKQNTQTARATPRTDTRLARPYFIEFRARSALSYGHTFAAFGQLNSRGEIDKFEVAGLHPAGDSSVPWSIGHVIAVPSETGPSDGDLEEEYVTARYRIDLTEPEARRVFAHIRKLQNSSPMWHAVVYNCSAFVADIGKFMGLRAPSSLLYPADFINGMREMNAGRAAFGGSAEVISDR